MKLDEIAQEQIPEQTLPQEEKVENQPTKNPLLYVIESFLESKEEAKERIMSRYSNNMTNKPSWVKNDTPAWRYNAEAVKEKVSNYLDNKITKIKTPVILALAELKTQV